MAAVVRHVIECTDYVEVIYKKKLMVSALTILLTVCTLFLIFCYIFLSFCVHFNVVRALTMSLAAYIPVSYETQYSVK